MARLPSRLQPLFPLLKRGHRFATRRVGALTRRTTNIAGARAVPAQATLSARETARLEPESVTLHPGGPAEPRHRPMPEGLPANHWFFDLKQDFTFAPRFTLEMRDGLVVGNYAAHITKGGLLDLETSSYFGITHWTEHPIYLRARLPEPQRVSGRLLSLAAPGSFGNYYHWLMDALPRLGVLAETMPGLAPDVLFTNSTSTYHRGFLDLLGLSHLPRVEASKHAAVRADSLLDPAIVNAHTMGPRWVTEWLRATFPAESTSDKPERLYITRGNQPNTRRVNNESAILAILQPLGFEVFDPGAHSVREQIDHFAAAKTIVAPHGAALTNLNFCTAGVGLLELFAPQYLNPGYWTIIDNVPDTKYRYLIGEGTDPGPKGSNNQVMADITVNLRQFQALLEEILD